MKKNNARKSIGSCFYTQVYNAYFNTAICDGWQYFFTFHLGPIEKSNLINIEDKN